jgi:hypothetical protein
VVVDSQIDAKRMIERFADLVEQAKAQDHPIELVLTEN